ncbi:MAG: hypothetical protein ACSHXF_06195 [Aquaticitalea sp.]
MAFLIGMPFFAMAQTFELHGTIVDSLNKPVVNAVILASDTEDESNILAYKNSDNNGHYKLTLKNELKLDSIWFIIKHFSYETIRLKIPFISNHKDFKLYPRVEHLDEVFVEYQKKVEVKGDTITYNVNGIQAEKDYTIEDVINRIPGVTIGENGQIKYNDKPISHLYINGIDLLEGRYNIATQGIPADAVKEIDVMKNHNHERIDIGRTESDDVAFNLKIKEDVSLFLGSVKGEAGLPLTEQLEGTPIYLNDKFQDIGSVKSNNNGKTLRNIGSDLTVGNTHIFSLKLDEAPVISAPNINGVVLSDKYWLDNDSYAITNDAIHKISDTTLVKWNINYINELSQIQTKSSTIYLTNNDSSVIDNKSRNHLRTQRFQAGINQEINKRNFYLKNITNYKYVNNTGIERILLNDNDIESNYQHSDFQISNSTIVKTLIRKDNIIQGGLITQYEQNSENLSVLPPVFESVFDENSMNEATVQNVYVKKFNVAGYTDFAFKWLNLNWNANQSVGYNSFKFVSDLEQVPEFTEQNFPFSSEFDFNKLSSSSKINSKINVGRISFSWGLSADFISLNTEEKNDLSLSKSNSYLFIQPYVSFKHKINSKWRLGSSYFQNTAISDFNQLYTPVVLTSFSTLVQNPNVVNRTRTKSIVPYLNYTNILKSIFVNLRGQWNETKSDVTFSNLLSNEGFITTEVVERPNSTTNYGLSINITKSFLGSFNSELSYSYNYTETELLFNNQIIDAINRRHNIDFGLTWDHRTWFTIEYEAKLNFGKSQTTLNQVENSTLFQTANIDFYTSSKTRLHVGVESSRAETSGSDANNNTLFNMSFFYKPSKKLFFKASLLNIFDTPFFSTTNGSSNFINSYQFSLRPRQFTIGFNYSL